MKTKAIIFFQCLFIAFQSYSQAVRVEIRSGTSGYQLLRGGQPYYVKGAGGTDYMSSIRSYGGNCVRTWGTGNAQAILDEAQRNGLTVLLGLHIVHPRNNPTFYDDPARVAAQYERCKQDIIKYRNHPALLMWGVGNEVHLGTSNTKVWTAVNDIAKLIKELDPNHPSMTVTAGFGTSLSSTLKSMVPDIHVVGINYYGSLSGVPQMVRNAGWTKPYMVTEYGPIGHWAVPTTAWGAPIEQTSTEKATMYQNNNNVISGDRAMCLGSFAFKWGHKQERTITWYSMHLKSGEETPTVDAMEYFWSGRWPANRGPVVQSITFDGKIANQSISLGAGYSFTATAPATDREGDRLTYEWVVMPESQANTSGGDFEQELQPIAGSVVTASGSSATIRIPSTLGNYRLYVYIRDGAGNVATANCPFRSVNAPPPPPVRSPYGGTPASIPGRIEAEHYDNGGQGIAYNDLTTGNTGGVFRTNDVDIQACSDAGGGFNVGWISTGEWLEYTVDVKETGTYNLDLRVATMNSGRSFQLEIDRINVSGTISVPNTGGWQNWQTVTIRNISLTQGIRVVRLAMNSGDFNINYFSFSRATITNSSCSGTAANNDYTYNAYSSGNTVKIRFNPGTAIAGTNMVILTYRVNSGGNIGIYMDPVSGSFTKEISVPAGATVTFYFTYRVGTTTTERNSSANPHTYVSGTSCPAFRQGDINQTEDNQLYSFNFYPNPANDWININLPDKNQEFEVSITTLDLDPVMPAQKMVSGSNMLDLKNISSGMYIITIKNSQHTYISKLVITR
ncbi:MAG: carbohydrate-binding protein [Cytophagaceae bacterium]